MDTGVLLTFHCLLTRQAEQISTIIVRTHTSWGTFVLDFLPTETIMCVRSYGVCQICPTSSAPAASADCGQLHFRATRLMTQTQRAGTSAGTSPSGRSCQK